MERGNFTDSPRPSWGRRWGREHLQRSRVGQLPSNSALSASLQNNCSRVGLNTFARSTPRSSTRSTGAWQVQDQRGSFSQTQRVMSHNLEEIVPTRCRGADKGEKKAWSVMQITRSLGGMIWIVTWGRPLTDFRRWSRQSLSEVIVPRHNFLHVH